MSSNDADGAAPKSERPTSFYRPQLDWLRFVAFSLVFMHHALPQDANDYVAVGVPQAVARWLAGAVIAGGFGVDIFFALSSFLITELLVREYDTLGKIDIGAFYVRRILRIWPLYYVFIFLSVFVFPRFLPGHLDGTHLLPFLFFFANWDAAKHGFNGGVASPLWSVSIEEQFYISWPLLLLIFGRKRLQVLGVALLAVAWLSRIVLVMLKTQHPGIWCNTLARLDPIACGVLLAFFGARIPKLSVERRTALLLAAFALLVVCGRYAGHAGLRALAIYPAVAIASVALLVCFLALPASNGRLARTVAYLGKISYGLYVFHLVGIELTHLIGVRRVLPAAALALLLTITLATTSFEVMERPILHLKRRFTRIASRPE